MEGGEQIKWFTLMSPCQQCAACKQIRLTDDAAEAPVSPLNHLSTAVWTEGSDSLSPSVCSSSLKLRLTLFRASWKVISHYFLCRLSSHRDAVTCQHFCHCWRNSDLCLCLGGAAPTLTLPFVPSPGPSLRILYCAWSPTAPH